MTNDYAFITPDGSNKTGALRTFDNAVRLLIDHLAAANHQPVLPEEAQFQGIHFDLPAEARSQNDLQKELASVIRLSMNPANTTYIGHMDSLASTYSIIGSLFAAALNNNMFSLEMSPYFTRMEYAITRQFAALFGLPPTSGGIIGSGGTLSNIQAIITARNWFLRSNDGAIVKGPANMVLFASEHAHISIRKAMMISGLGVDALIAVRADANGKMDVTDLRDKIATAKRQGKAPFAVVATIGTTVTGNIDPIDDIARICEEHGCWFHADAIYGGAIILSRGEKHRLRGIEGAHSISFNPQKWMHVAKTCSMLLFRDAEMARTYFSMKATYVKEQSEFVNLSELGLQGTKQADVLKLWLSILSIGLSGYERMIDRAYAMTHRFRERLGRIGHIEFATPSEMNIPTFRLTARTDDESDRINGRFNEFALRRHNLFFSLPTFRGRLWQRTILLNPFIDEGVIDNVAAAIADFDGVRIG